MVHHANLKAGLTPARETGRVDPWRDPFGADQRLSSLAGDAKRIRAATVSAGEGS